MEVEVNEQTKKNGGRSIYVPFTFLKAQMMDLGHCFQSIIIVNFLFGRIFTSLVVEDCLWRNIAILLGLDRKI